MGWREGSGLGAARAWSFQPLALSPHVGHAPHLFSKGLLVFLVLALFLFLLIATLVDIAARDAVDIGPLGRLVGAEVVVGTERFPEPLVQPRIPVPGRKHLSNQPPVKVPRHGLQQVAMARDVKDLEADDALPFGSPG